MSFTLELTTPACPVKEEFDRLSKGFVGDIEWCTSVNVNMTAQPVTNDVPDTVAGMRGVRHVIAVSSCKGGVGKSTTSVNLAYTLAMMGAKVGIFDADVFGPSLPTMTSPEQAVLQMDAETGTIKPTPRRHRHRFFRVRRTRKRHHARPDGQRLDQSDAHHHGLGRAGLPDHRHAPPGRRRAAHAVPGGAHHRRRRVTTPQKLAFIDVEKGVRMFSKLQVPCVAVVENMSYFEVDGVKHKPFGEGSGQKICDDYGVPNLFQMPIVPELSACGDTGVPLVLKDPAGETSALYGSIAAKVVQEVAKLSGGPKGGLELDRRRRYRASPRRLCAATRERGRGCRSRRAADVRRSDRSARAAGEAAKPSS